MHAKDLQNEINTETSNPIVAPTPISGGFTVTATPNKPGEVASYTLTFQVAADLVNGVDEIIITWDKDFKNFPSVISTTAVSIRAVGDGGGCGGLGEDLTTCGVTGGNGNEGQAVAPEEINVDFVTPESADLQPQTNLLIPDMDTDDNSGGNGIRAGATVTVVFRQQAGISNPTENNDNYHFDLRVTDFGVDPGFVDAVRAVPDLFIQARMQPSNDDGKRGGSFTVVASGIEGNESITFWRDANGDGVRQAGEFDLCFVLVADSDDTATCTFTISNPPFTPGTEGPGGSCTFPLPLVDCNFINFLDSQGRTTTGSLSAALDQEAVDRQKFELDQTISVAPSVTQAGDLVTISLFDWPAGAVTRMTIANIDVDLPNPVPVVPPSGEVSFTFLIPGVGSDGTTKIPSGVNPLKIFAGGVNEATNITILEETCVIPGSGDWIVSASCTFQGSATASGNVIVEPGIALTIDTGAALDINFSSFHLLIRDGAKIVIKSGGKIF